MMGHRNLVHYFKAAFICNLFVLRTNLALISSVGVLPSGSVMVYFMLNAKIFLLPHAHLTETTPGNHGSQAVYSATSFASTHTIQKFAQSVINKHLSCMMSLLHVSALQHDRISLCVLFHSHPSCTVFVSDTSLLQMGHTNLFHSTSILYIFCYFP